MNVNGSKWTCLTLIPILIVLITGINYYINNNTTGDPPTYKDWSISTPERESMIPSMLDEVVEVISGEGLPVDSVVIVRNGCIVKEYSSPSANPDKKYKLYSATKSITSALIGIAIQGGYIEGVDQKIMDYFPDKIITDQDLRQEITIRHLLTMTAGYEWGNDGTGTGMRTSADPVQYVLDKTMVQTPGTVYNYGDGAPFLLGAIIHEATGMTVLEFAKEYLFDPLNITDVYWEANGNQYFAASGLWMCPRDMAKIGQLFLNQGKWGEKQIISRDWVRESTKIQVSGQGFMAGDDFFVDGYGYLWWIYPESGVFYASGMYEQRIYVCPELEIVAVFTAHNNGAEVTPRLLFQYILPACEEYTPTIYDNYNVRFEYPRGMNLVEAPSPLGEDNVSEDSGFVQAYFTYPVQSFSVMWYSRSEDLRLEAEMNRLFSMIESETTVVQRGLADSLEVDGRTVIYLSANVTENGYTTSGMIGGLFEEDTERVVLTYYIVDPEFFSKQEIKNTFLNHITSMRDH